MTDEKYYEVKNRFELACKQSYSFPSKEQLENICDMLITSFDAIMANYTNSFKNTFHKYSNNYRKMHKLPLKRKIKI
jgi:hypothetical protein